VKHKTRQHGLQEQIQRSVARAQRAKPEGKQMACLEQNFEHTHFENQTTAPADDTDTVIRADDSTCQECTYLNYCQLTPNHSGPHMCSQGHRW
jgi:hypothetical protein